MAKSKAEYQAAFREKHGNKFKRLDMLLPIDDFNLLHGRSLEAGLTKVAYICKLLHCGNKGNAQGDTALNAEIKRLTLLNNSLELDNDGHQADVKQQKKTIKDLKSKIETIEGYQTKVAASTIPKLIELRIYEYALTDDKGVEHIYVENGEYHHRDLLKGLKKPSAWGYGLNGGSIIKDGCDLYMTSDKGDRLLTDTGKKAKAAALPAKGNGRGKPLTHEKEALIIELLGTDKTKKQISLEANVGEASVYRVQKKLKAKE